MGYAEDEWCGTPVGHTRFIMDGHCHTLWKLDASIKFDSKRTNAPYQTFKGRSCKDEDRFLYFAEGVCGYVPKRNGSKGSGIKFHTAFKTVPPSAHGRATDLVAMNS